LGEKFDKISTRTLTMVIILPIALAIIHFGGILYYGTISIIAILAFIELWYIVKSRDYRPSLILGLVLTLFLLFLKNILDSQSFSYAHTVFTLLFFLIILEHFFLKLTKNSIMNIALTIFMCVYIGHLLSFFIEIMGLKNGSILLTFSLFSTWISDIFAYLIGVYFGKNHPFPYLSPNKTLEGAIGGIFGGGICSLAFYSTIPIKLPILFLLGIIAAIFGQMGDLFESLIKRNFGVKDSGKLIPGHGGILDCIDSILFSIPILFYSFKLLLK
jgi:phosphatidate cytidylyltransferase